MVLDVQHLDQSGDIVVEVALKVEMDESAPQDRMKVLVDILVSQTVLQVVVVGS